MLLLKMKKKREVIINLTIWKKLFQFVVKNLKIKINVDNIKFKYILKSYAYIN